MYGSIKLNTCQVNTASRWWSTKKMESRTLEFKAATEAQRAKMGESLVPCLSRVQLEDMGVRIDSFRL